MTKFIESLEIDGFRALSNVKINEFGRINLITGRNNSGKSSVLEAIRILSTGGSLRTLYEILDYREEFRRIGEPESQFATREIPPFSSLFEGFPDISKSSAGFTIRASGAIGDASSKLRIGVNWYIRKSDADGAVFTLEPAGEDLFEDTESTPALEIEIGGRKRIITLDRLQRRSYVSRIDPESQTVPCVYLDPFSSRSTSQMGALWDAIALTDSEQEIVKALKVISDDIQAVSVIGSDERTGRARTAIARSSRHHSPIPLRTFGDGVNRLFGVVLSLCNARNGVLLVDEIENGLHYSVQTAIWRTIFALASSLNVQVFATSHSWDCVRSFQEAASESPEEGALIRLTKRGDALLTTVFSEEELAIVTRDQVEVR